MRLSFPVKFAKIYGYIYWGAFGIVLAFVLPFIDAGFMGPESTLGSTLDAFPNALTQEALFFSHAWGIAMLTFLISNALGYFDDMAFIKSFAIVSVLYLPVCGYCMVNDWGFFWKLSFPVLYIFNAYVYISAGWFSPEANNYSEVSTS